MARCGDYDSSNPVHRSLDLVTAIKVAQYNTHVVRNTRPCAGLHPPPGLGRDDGHLHRAELHGVQRGGGDEPGEAGRRAGEVTTVHCTACTVLYCTLYSHEVGTWHPGTPAHMDLQPGAGEELLSFQAKKVERL